MQEYTQQPFEAYPQDPKDLRSEEGLFRILENGSICELKSLQEFYEFSDDDVRLFRYFVRLRKGAHKGMKRHVHHRILRDPRATPEELDMGAYTEALEPQVRNAVLLLRTKGYTTISSGFDWLDTQRILFARSHLTDFAFEPETARRLEESGVRLEVQSNSVGFQLRRPLTLRDMKNIWDTIADSLPDLGAPAGPSTTPIAKVFREDQQRLTA
jgi:hypothetical protein